MVRTVTCRIADIPQFCYGRAPAEICSHLGHCHLRVEPRIFLADRIQDVVPLEDEFQAPPEFSAEDLLNSSPGIYLGAAGEAVLRFGAMAEVLEPPKLREAARTELQRMADLYNTPPS